MARFVVVASTWLAQFLAQDSHLQQRDGEVSLNLTGHGHHHVSSQDGLTDTMSLSASRSNEEVVPGGRLEAVDRLGILLLFQCVV